MENQKTIKNILLEMKVSVENKDTVSPTQWLEWALSLNTLWQDLKIELTKAEIEYAREIVELLEKDIPKNKAEMMVKAKKVEGMSAYEKLSYLRGRDKLVDEFIKLAKRYAIIEQSL